LREVIFAGQDYITVQADYYQVNPEYLEWCDVLAFERLFERAARAAAEEALPLRLELIDLYLGEFLGGFEISDWGAAHRVEYELKFLQAVELACEQLLRMNRAEETLTVINKGLAIDYFHETLHHLAFKAYTQLRLYDQLTNHYTKLCSIFEQEFKMPPSIATKQLYEQLMAAK
jgi:two-component SAPR family response regulator